MVGNVLCCNAHVHIYYRANKNAIYNRIMMIFIKNTKSFIHFDIELDYFCLSCQHFKNENSFPDHNLRIEKGKANNYNWLKENCA